MGVAQDMQYAKPDKGRKHKRSLAERSVWLDDYKSQKKTLKQIAAEVGLCEQRVGYIVHETERQLQSMTCSRCFILKRIGGDHNCGTCGELI